jgi:hypothetical protein
MNASRKRYIKSLSPAIFTFCPLFMVMFPKEHWYADVAALVLGFALALMNMIVFEQGREIDELRHRMSR